MPALTLRTPVPPLPPHPKVKIRAASGATLELPLGPTGGNLGGWARRWVAIDLPGRRPVLADAGPGLRTTAYTLNIAHPDGRPITDVLHGLRGFAEARAGIYTILGLGIDQDTALEFGPWRITACSVPRIRRRQHGTNHPLLADVDIEFTQAETPNLRIGRSGRVAR